ncbi:hypothetical protein BHE74_00010307 [Ensete ventricosum]|nr:hypothetical protein GW17_00045490 [Ensete ventricosum]RWW81345.1 hypothetical protein BHE74_00010307 [Ensete ventricosum]RZR97327.1 hypothetical protein BHM03_00026484 [Ensete ventricosum]
MEVPWITTMEIESGDDVGMEREESGLAVEEMDDELFVGGEEAETRREIRSSFSHGWSGTRESKEQENEERMWKQAFIGDREVGGQ